MKSLIFWAIALIGLFYLTDNSYAEDWSLKFGPSIQNGSTNGSSKMFGVRREEDLMDGLSYSFEGGGYVDNGGNGRKSSGLMKAQLGVTPGPVEGVFGKAFFGPCVITSKDTQLGSNEQFCTDIGFGVRDKKTFMDIGYAHVSNAGIFGLPNQGRDAILFEAGFRFD